jgi:hypothetical protein
MRDRDVSRITPRFAIIVAIVLGLFYGAMWLWPPARGAEPARPYSCRLLDDEQKKCAFGSCDARTVDRLRKECLRDGGRP